jgi:hypothetical protein
MTIMASYTKKLMLRNSATSANASQQMKVASSRPSLQILPLA